MYLHLWWHLGEFLEWELFQTNIVEKTKRRILYSVLFFFFQKTVLFLRLCGKIWYSHTGHTWRCNTAHALCMLDKQCYRHALRICNTYCFSTAAVVTVMCLSVTLYVHCLSCWCRAFPQWAALGQCLCAEVTIWIVACILGMLADEIVCFDVLIAF